MKIKIKKIDVKGKKNDYVVNLDNKDFYFVSSASGKQAIHFVTTLTDITDRKVQVRIAAEATGQNPPPRGANRPGQPGGSIISNNKRNYCNGYKTRSVKGLGGSRMISSSIQGCVRRITKQEAMEKIKESKNKQS